MTHAPTQTDANGILGMVPQFIWRQLHLRLVPRPQLDLRGEKHNCVLPKGNIPLAPTPTAHLHGTGREDMYVHPCIDSYGDGLDVEAVLGGFVLAFVRT